MKLRTLSLLACAAAAAATAALLASSATGSTGAAGGRTLRFTSISRLFVGVPALSDTSGPKLGSRMVFEDVMRNRVAQFGKPAGALVGRSEGACTVMSETRPEAQCLITAHVPDGQIVVAADGNPGAKVSRYAIVGGIGAYAGARGTVVATTIDDSHTLIVVHIA